MHSERKKRERELKSAAETKETRDILHEYTKYVETELQKQKYTENKLDIATYYNWCITKGHYKHRYGYCSE